MSAPVSSLPALTGTPDGTFTASGMAAEAAAILLEVRQAEWPETREAHWAIGWAVTVAARVLADYYRLLNGDMLPHEVRAPDMGWWDDDERQALEWAADEALQCAKSAAKRLAEYRRREFGSEGEKA